MPAILFVLTSVSTTLTGAPTVRFLGVPYLPEAAHPYYILAPHATVDFASPGGANPPLDPASIAVSKIIFYSVKIRVSTNANSRTNRMPPAYNFWQMRPSKASWPPAKKLSEVSSKAMSQVLMATRQFYQGGKITSAVCHGPAALVNVTDAEGKSIFAGRAATGFSNVEEIQMDKVKVGEIDIASTRCWVDADFRTCHSFFKSGCIISLGGKYEKAAEPWVSHVVVDGNVYTGQNPASAAAIGQVILKALELQGSK
ncbi:Glutathione-independent glyoxalase HSP31 [Mycena venus]|uniref:D-lactate dehydratase n=1 Tax=Mycena venus TaxID=2733690 RepID=A0A8H6Y3Y2_9AGAR|nr:Glutathione-independent glyoxalase HSP31 [Mycena venus]